MKKILSLLLSLSLLFSQASYAAYIPAATKQDDAAFVPATDNVDMFGGEYDDSTPDSVNEGDAGALRMSANRNLYATLRDAAGNERGLNIDANGALAATVTNATASNLKVAATLDAETTKVIGTVRNLGNIGAIYDGVNTAATAPANGLLGLGIYNSTEPSPTTGQSVGIQLDSKGRQRGVIMDAAGNTRGANVNASSQLSVSVDNTATIDSELPAAATIAADGVTPTVPGAAAYNFIKTPSANTWDRQYSVVAGQDTTGTGIQATGIQAQLDDASTTSVTENQFANIRLSSRRALLVEGVASGTAQPISAASGSIASGAIASGAIASGAIAAGAIATGATSIAANEDDLSANLDTGVKVLCVQKATPADTGGTDGDYMSPQMSAGRIWTAAILPSGSVASGAIASGAVASGAVASGAVASGSISSGAIASGALASGSIAAGAIANGATSIAENEDVASVDADRGVKVWAIKDNTLDARSGTEGDYEPFHTDANGALWTDLNIAGTAAVSGSGTATGALRVELANNGTGLLSTVSTVTTVSTLSNTTQLTPGTAAANLGKAEDAAHTSADVGVMGLAVRESAPTDLSAGATNGDYEPLQLSTNGELWVNASTGASSIAKNEDVASAGADTLLGVAQIRLDTPVSGANVSGSADYTNFIADSFGRTWVAGSWSEDVASAGGDSLMVIGAKRLDTPVANANVGTDGDYANIQTDNFGKVWVSGTVPEDTAHIGGEAITNSGSRRIDTLATSAGTSGDIATVNQSAEGGAWATLAGTATPNGLLVGNFTSGDSFTALTNTAQVIKASAGNMYGYYIYNPNSSATYVMIYNVAAASVTVGTTNPTLVFCIPATSGANLMFPVPIPFSNAGWSIAAATTGGGNSAPSTALEAMVWYL